ncbi:putative ribonuclease H-like domain-containing protein [Tanacetum coccineum]
MCDKKNSVLFTNTECVVLSPDFKLTDESHVLLKVPIKDNMYSVDLNNVVPQGGLTYLFAKATPLNLYLARRLGHLNFKTMNKLVRGNLVRGRKPALSFMRPFGCPVTILNTIDHLGKFDGKADEGFFVGYSTNSKAFRVFNSRTRIVKENLRVQFCENTSNITGSGPNWLFDIDALPNSMNYKPVVARNQSNGNADPSLSSSPKDSPDAGFKPSGEEEKKDAEDPGNEGGNLSEEGERINQGKDASINATNNINTVSPTVNAANIEDNAIDENIVYRCADDPNIPDLEEIGRFSDAEDDGAEADMTNLDTHIPQRTNHNGILKMLGLLLFFKEEPKKVIQALKEPSQIEAMNKKDERGIVIKNKERIEAIRLFLAYASYKGFVVYKMDVKSAFLYGKIEEEVYVCQPPGFKIQTSPTNDVKTARTPMETHKPLLKDADGEDVDEHLYRSMIGSFTYLTSSRPDIMFAVCQPKLGLWYPKDSPFDLVAYTNSDYAGASLDRKSTTGGCQFLGCRLILWQCKKQTVVSNSTTKAEYIVVSNCCGQVLWIQNQFLGYGYNFMQTKIHIDNESTICIVKNPVFHSKTKHIEIRHHFIRDSNEKKLIQMIKIHTNQNVANLLTKAFNVSRFEYLIAIIGIINL